MPDRTSPRALPSLGGSVDILALLQGDQEEQRDTAFECDLVRRWQQDLPLDPEPFACIAAASGHAQRDVLKALRRLQREGVIARVGAVLTPAAFGASTLAALSVEPDTLDAIAGYISLMPEVNHNYARDHHYNLWFVLSAANRSRIDAVLGRIQEATGCVPLDLPMLEGYHLDLAADPRGLAPRAVRAVDVQRVRMPLDLRQWRLLAALEQGLPLVPRPFARLGMRAGMHEREVIEQLRDWLVTGAVRRLGIVVRTPQFGVTANAMCVWDVPDAEAGRIGNLAAGMPGVTLCYRRSRVASRWPFNLYCMIQGNDRESVLAFRAEVEQKCGLAAYPADILFSNRRYKQCGVHSAERE